ncbi:MAG: hypothetical protein ACR2KK_07770 [Acidimicrobiales bacterium]
MQGAAARARRASTPVVGLLLAVLTWRDVRFSPIAGLDPSWHAALHMAARQRVPFDDLVFTFGPLGFLTQPVVYYASTGLLSGLYVLGLQTALCAALVSVLRRTIGLPAAAVVTFVLASAGRELKAAELVVVVVVVVAFGLLRGDHPPRAERLLVSAAGVVAGTHLLVKFNTGVIVTVVAVLTAWFVGLRAWRSETVLLGTALVSLLGGWMLTGNRLGDLVPFVDRSLEVAAGYSETMGIELSGRAVFYPVALLVTAVVVALGWTASRDWLPARRVGLGLVGTMWLYGALKHGFVRHDEHDIVFFGEALLVGAGLAGAALASFEGWRRWLPAGGGAVLLAASLGASGLGVPSIVDPLPALRRAGSDLMTFASSQRQDRAVDKARAALRRSYDLAPATLAALAGRTVHVRPWEASVAWAYPELRWKPVPVFQEYSAYTAGLDHRNAAFLAGPSGPERVLTEQETVDLRNPDWDSPAAVVALVCHYRELAVQARWQVLGRIEDRCGAEEPLGTVLARVGDVVTVPDTGGRDVLVVARIRGLDASPLYGLRSTLWRLPPVHLTLDGGRRFRLVPGTAANGLVVRAPAPARLGFSQPFAPESATSFQVDHRGAVGLGSSLTIEFVAIPVLN